MASVNDPEAASDGTARLQALSLELIRERDASALYQKIVDAASAIMQSDFASMQMLHPERGRGGELRLLAFKGFDPESARFWEWVRADSKCTCGVALLTRKRVIAADVENAGFMAGTEDQRVLLAAGIRAAQTTPLVSREGAVIGMISTHWAEPHQPSGQALRLFDILARQAADLIERMRAEEALRASEARYASVLGLMPAAVYTIDAAGAITYFNEHAAALWGRSPTLGESDERFCGAFRLWLPHGAPLPHAQTPMAIAAREGRSFRNEEVVIERPDGSRITVLVNIDPMRDAAGRVTGAINVFHDVTERRQAEQRVRESEARLRAIVETTPECVKIVAADGTLLQMNASGLAMVGAPAAEAVLGRCIYDMIAPEHRDRFRAFNEAVCRGEAGSLEFDIVGLGGGRRSMETHAVPLPLGEGATGQLAITRDITERRAVASALRSSEERYRAVVESQTEMVCRFRPDGTLLFVNAAYARARGTTPEALLASSFWDHIPQADHAGVKAMLARMTPASPEAQIENRLQTAEGERWTLWTNRALAFDAAGRVAEAQSTGIDITERKRAEELLRDADRRKDEFLAILSHELRNPLSPIRNSVVALRDGGDDPAVRAKALPVLERQVAHLIRLVEDLLDVSRINRGDIVLQKRASAVADIVSSAIETSRPLVDARGHRLDLRLPQQPLAVDGDPVRLSQVVANLVNNAATYTPEGGRIEVSVREEAGQAAICVRDNGPGIPASALQNLFVLFSRGDNAGDHPGGFGVGLALAKRLVEMHGGTMAVESEGPGSGAAFTVRLPLCAPEAAKHPASPRPPAASGKRILVVDDNSDAADSLGLVLRMLGAEVRVVHDGATALAAYEAERPSLVLLDIGMPGMNGYDIAREIRTRYPERRAALVALTGWGQEDDRRRAREAGFDHHLVKPAEIGMLESLLSSIQ